MNETTPVNSSDSSKSDFFLFMMAVIALMLVVAIVEFSKIDLSTFRIQSNNSEEAIDLKSIRNTYPK